MDKIDVINNIFKMFIITMYTYFVYSKITGYKNINSSKIIIGIISSLVISLLSAFTVSYINSIIIFPIICFAIGIIISNITKERIGYCIITSMIAFIMTYFIYLISVMISGIIVELFLPNFNNRLINLLFISLIMFCILYFFFSIKRFKDGFNFLRNTENVSNIGMYGLLFFGILLLLYGIIKKTDNYLVLTYISTGIILLLIALIIWIQVQITSNYEDNMKIKTIDIQNNELEVKERVIADLKAENFKLSEAVHKYNKRFCALESSIILALNSNFSTETSSELSIMLDDLKSISGTFSKEVHNSSISDSLPSTGIRGIDNIFKYMASQCAENNINFSVKITNTILPIIDTVIRREDFETLVGDHVTDAIIAINSSNGDKRDIMCMLGIVNNCYEFSVYDTGIDFEIDTLINLGLKRITTHKDTGGSGIGFMTTFDTLRRCKASLIIEEYDSKISHYTKSIIIRVDGKCEYKIRSYRSSKIQEQDKDNRIIIEDLP